MKKLKLVGNGLTDEERLCGPKFGVPRDYMIGKLKPPQLHVIHSSRRRSRVPGHHNMSVNVSNKSPVKNLALTNIEKTEDKPRTKKNAVTFSVLPSPDAIDKFRDSASKSKRESIDSTMQ